MKPFFFAPLRLRALGKMKASKDGSGHSCFHSQSSFASPSGRYVALVYPLYRDEPGFPIVAETIWAICAASPF